MQDDSAQQTSPENPGWLDRLQQDRWQAEILISGGGLIGVLAVMDSSGDVLEVLWHSMALTPFLVSSITIPLFSLTFILAEAFLLHLILRGYWIGLVGFNYVFPQGVNQEKLGLQGKFKSIIKNGSNIPHLLKLDSLCSLTFAFAFFLIFSIAGFFIYILCVIGFVELLRDYLDSRIIRRIAAIILFALGLLTLVDFFTFGYLKKVRWFTRFYYPIHYVVSRITLSFLYRRLYYSIISNIRPLYIILGIPVQILIFALLGSLEEVFPRDISPVKSGEGKFLELEDEIITGNSLRFSFSHFPTLEDTLFSEWRKSHSDAKAESFSEIPAKDKLDLVASAYIISIDSVQADSLIWVNGRRDVLGFTTTRLFYLADVGHLARGRHELAIRMRLRHKDFTSTDYYFAKGYFLVDK